MVESLLQLDHAVFTVINQEWIHPWLDVLFRNVTDLHRVPLVFAALVVTFLYFCVRKFKRQAWRPILALVMAVGISDLVAYRLMKKIVDRPRPFQSESMSGVRKLADAHGNSFPSNHSANCFAAAFILGICFPRRRYLFYIFAGIVAYSRVYVGVHYPSDILVGALVGLTVGYLTAFFMLNQLKSWSKEKS